MLSQADQSTLYLTWATARQCLCAWTVDTQTCSLKTRRDRVYCTIKNAAPGLSWKRPKNPQRPSFLCYTKNTELHPQCICMCVRVHQPYRLTWVLWNDYCSASDRTPLSERLPYQQGKVLCVSVRHWRGFCVCVCLGVYSCCVLTQWQSHSQMMR